jgi:hypothetical protein
MPMTADGRLTQQPYEIGMQGDPALWHAYLNAAPERAALTQQAQQADVDMARAKAANLQADARMANAQAGMLSGADPAGALIAMAMKGVPAAEAQSAIQMSQALRPVPVSEPITPFNAMPALAQASPPLARMLAPVEGHPPVNLGVLVDQAMNNGLLNDGRVNSREEVALAHAIRSRYGPDELRREADANPRISPIPFLSDRYAAERQRAAPGVAALLAYLEGLMNGDVGAPALRPPVPVIPTGAVAF